MTQQDCVFSTCVGEECLHHCIDQLLLRGLPLSEIAAIVEVDRSQLEEHCKAQAQAHQERGGYVELAWFETLALLVHDSGKRIRLSLMSGTQTIGDLEPFELLDLLNGVERKLMLQERPRESGWDLSDLL